VKPAVSEVLPQGGGQLTASPAKPQGRPPKYRPNIASFSANPNSTRQAKAPLKTLAAKTDPGPIKPKTVVANEKYETPPRTLATPSTAAVIPSIEKDTFQIIIPRMQIPPLDVSSPSVDTNKAYECNVCGKRYKRLGGFEKHKLLPACANTMYDEEKKRKLAERENLVKQALERQL